MIDYACFIDAEAIRRHMAEAIIPKFKMDRSYADNLEGSHIR